MAYAETRSMNAELSEGMTDGKYKKITRDWSHDAGATAKARADLDPIFYSNHEKQVKTAPDGLLHATPSYAPNPPSDLTQY